ncbi:MAG: DUF2804 domain-containing protein [Myxococcaceae bacterium]
MELPPAPECIPDAAGRPCLGTYQGELGEVRLGALRPPHGISSWRLPLRRKAWVYALVTTPDVILATAAVDLGYASNAFLTVVDLREKRALVDFGAVGLPAPFAQVNERPARGLRAHFRSPGARLAFRREQTSSSVHLDVALSAFRTGGAGPVRLQLELSLDGAPPPVAVVAAVPGGGLNVTEKSGGLRPQGTLDVGRRSIPLEGGVAGLDVTMGLLARVTAWRWAMGVGRLEDGRLLSVNLVEGFNDGPGENENAVWLGAALHPLGRARFGFGRDDPLALWHLESETGDFSLRFRPLHLHREERNLGLVRSRFWQLQGFFVGTLRAGGEVVQVTDLPGVTEDQEVRW